MDVIRWLIITGNRVGLIQDVVGIFSQGLVNIEAMEVSIGNVFVKFFLENQKEICLLRDALLIEKDIFEIIDINLLPQEQKEQELQAIMESINEGIISLDIHGAIHYINPNAANLLHLDIWQFTGKKADEILGINLLILETLQNGKTFDNQEIMMETHRGNVHYLSSGRPIRDENNRIIGAVAILNSIKAAQQLVDTIRKSRIIGFEDIIHTSKRMKKVIAMSQKVAANDCTILIRGESGTGKELFARAIHKASKRNDKPFIPINCAAIPETLLESELFGYDEGAFSGAKKGGKMGLFESANQGTLFLDEIGEMSIILQGKLLRVLQEGVIRRVGGTREIPVDVRILAATNRNLEEMVKLKQFRQDLYYRINVIPIYIDPLRERPEDISILLYHIANEYSQRLNKQLDFTKEAINYLISYSWPGNVRELQNIIMRAAYLTSSGLIDVEDLLINDATNNNQSSNCSSNSSNDSWSDNIVVDGCRQGDSLKKTIGNVERAAIENALKKYGSARKVAKNFGISHTSVLKKVHRYGLDHLLKNGRGFKDDRPQ